MHMRNKALRYIFTTLVLSRFSADNPQTSVPPPGLAVPFDNNATSAKYPFYDLPVMECTKEIDDVAPILAVPWSTPTTGLPFLQLTTRVVNNGVQGLPSLGEALSFTSFEGLCTHMLQVVRCPQLSYIALNAHDHFIVNLLSDQSNTGFLHSILAFRTPFRTRSL